MWVGVGGWVGVCFNCVCCECVLPDGCECVLTNLSMHMCIS